MKDSFIFYDSFLIAIDELEELSQLKIYRAITHFAIRGEEPENLNGIEKAIFALIKPQIEANERKQEQYLQDVENGKKGAKYGKLGGRPPKNDKEKTPLKTPGGFLKNNPPKNPINVNVNVNENVNVECEGECNTPAPENHFSNLNLDEWYGEYSNVHLTQEQYKMLECNIVGNKKVLDGLINELSNNIAQKNPKAPPYDEQYPDMHYAKIKTYWNYRKLNGDKPRGQPDKAIEFKQQLEALTEKYRIKEVRSG